MKNSMYGWVGFLSILGVLGLMSGEYALCGFFGFAVHFEFFFVKSDEMLVEYMNRTAARAFIFGMLFCGVATAIGYLVLQTPINSAFVSALGLSWGFSLFYYCLTTAYYGLKEGMGGCND